MEEKADTEVKAEDVKLSIDERKDLDGGRAAMANEEPLGYEETKKGEDDLVEERRETKEDLEEKDVKTGVREEEKDENPFVMVEKEDADPLEGGTEKEREDREIVAKRNDINNRPKIAFTMKIIENFNVLIFIISLGSVLSPHI
eukprot:TRINITY_DN11962_c0_g1_i2.p1 TRINITY_DN11962_c0_g1~~TRINITY_DN11962_c0_g1_i2.p1  ORF type:complete len:144 (+),score=56.07 TRINITY_DN11962_c0_g1_i2:67-498(+)